MVRSRDPRVPPRLRLAPDWRPARDAATGRLAPAGGRLWEFTEKIASSRREGKNRRDGATVSTRVVGLAEALGGKLFGEAMAGGEDKGKGGVVAPATLSGEEARELGRAVREQKRRRSLERRARL